MTHTGIAQGVQENKSRLHEASRDYVSAVAWKPEASHYMVMRRVTKTANIWCTTCFKFLTYDISFSPHDRSRRYKQTRRAAQGHKDQESPYWDLPGPRALAAGSTEAGPSTKHRRHH